MVLANPTDELEGLTTMVPSHSCPNALHCLDKLQDGPYLDVLLLPNLVWAGALRAEQI
jgi:hypothetical protein